jgi:alpha-galactosidase
LKYDFCDCDGCDARAAYTKMGAALAATRRPMLFNICSWGGGAPHTWGAPVAHSWRTGRDVFATFSVASEKALGLPSFLQSVMSSADATEPLAAFAGPGHVNDPDMLLVGIDGMKPYGKRGAKGVRRG